MKTQRQSGLPRALFCVRLLELAGEGTPDDRFSFLAGAFIAADLDALVARGILVENIPVLIVGSGTLGEAWREALHQRSISADVLADDKTEKGLLAGLKSVLLRAVAPQAMPAPNSRNR